MKIAFATPELHSLVRRTQLSEIAEQLPRTLQALGHEVRIFLPHSKDLDSVSLGPLEESALLRIRDGQGRTPVTIRTGYVAGLTIHLIDHEHLFRSRHPYGDENGPYADNWRRFAIFSRAVLDGFGPLAFTPDVIHCFDWTTGLIPLVQQLEYKDRDHPAAKPGTFFAVQNLAMQGSFERAILPKIGLPHEYFRAIEGVELGSRVNYLKAGAEFATLVGARPPAEPSASWTRIAATARRTRSAAARTTSSGSRTASTTGPGTLRTTRSSLRTTASRTRRSRASASARPRSRRMKLENGPRTPLLAVIGRFDADSGFEILAESLTPILERGVQVVLMGPGPSEIIERLHMIEQTFVGRCRVVEGYDVTTAHTLLAAADMLLLPGHYHATNALAAIAMRYGVVPMAYAHSGLEDTLVDLTASPKKGTGLLFDSYEAASLEDAIDRGRAVYKKATDWRVVAKRCMEQDFSWAESGREYVKAYKKVVKLTKPARKKKK